MEKKKRISKMLGSRVFWAIVSVLGAMLLWMYVNTTETTEITKTYSDVTVVFDGKDVLREQKSLIVTDVETTNVTLRLTGPRRELVKIDASQLSVSVDLSSIYKTGNYTVAYTVTYPENVDSSNIRVEVRTPNTVTYRIDKLSSKNVEIKMDNRVSAAEDYVIDEITTSQDYVKITGPESVLEQIAFALVTVERDAVDASTDFDATYILVDADGEEVNTSEYEIEFESEFVNVSIAVSRTKTVVLKMDVVYGAGATEANTIITVEPQSITLAGDATVLDGINQIGLGTIDLASFESSFEETYSIAIPDGVENLEGVTEAKVTIKILNLATKKFTSTSITATNAAKDNYEIITQSLEVTIRAAEDVLGQISANNIRIVVDLSEYSDSSGTVTPPYKVYVDGYTDAGAIITTGKIYVNLG